MPKLLSKILELVFRKITTTEFLKDFSELIRHVRDLLGAPDWDLRLSSISLRHITQKLMFQAKLMKAVSSHFYLKIEFL